MGEVKSVRGGEIPEISISEVGRARLTDGPVQTTRFSPQELGLNFSTAGRHTWSEGGGCKWGNGGKRGEGNHCMERKEEKM